MAGYQGISGCRVASGKPADVIFVDTGKPVMSVDAEGTRQHPDLALSLLSPQTLHTDMAWDDFI